MSPSRFRYVAQPESQLEPAEYIGVFVIQNRLSEAWAQERACTYFWQDWPAAALLLLCVLC